MNDIAKAIEVHRPNFVATFDLGEGLELVVLIERAGDSPKLIVGRMEMVLPPYRAVEIGKAMKDAGYAALTSRKQAHFERKRAERVAEEAAAPEIAP